MVDHGLQRNSDFLRTYLKLIFCLGKADLSNLRQIDEPSSMQSFSTGESQHAVLAILESKNKEAKKYRASNQDQALLDQFDE